MCPIVGHMVSGDRSSTFAVHVLDRSTAKQSFFVNDILRAVFLSRLFFGLNFYTHELTLFSATISLSYQRSQRTIPTRRLVNAMQLPLK